MLEVTVEAQNNIQKKDVCSKDTASEFNSPFQYYEVVEIVPIYMITEPNVVSLIGKRGVILGMDYDNDFLKWAYTVAIQSGECWYFDEDELRKTSIILTKDILYSSNGQEIPEKKRVNFLTEEVVSSDVVLMPPGDNPVPLRVNLAALTRDSQIK
jgi:hypothetical protein